MSRVLIVILARGGSQRIPGKNLRTLAGIPLVGRAARRARQAVRGLEGGPHLVVCSTDDREIGATAVMWGADRIVDRPEDLASETATSADAFVHALRDTAREGPFDAAVLIQPTSPLLDPEVLRAGIETFLAGDG